MPDFQIDIVPHQEGWAVFTGSEGEDPTLSAWFKDKPHAEKWVKDHEDDESEFHVFDPHITRSHINASAWNDFHDSPDMDVLLSQILDTI